jgi:hypothetical protein
MNKVVMSIVDQVADWLMVVETDHPQQGQPLWLVLHSPQLPHPEVHPNRLIWQVQLEKLLQMAPVSSWQGCWLPHR